MASRVSGQCSHANDRFNMVDVYMLKYTPSLVSTTKWHIRRSILIITNVTAYTSYGWGGGIMVAKLLTLSWKIEFVVTMFIYELSTCKFHINIG